MSAMQLARTSKPSCATIPMTEVGNDGHVVSNVLGPLGTDLDLKYVVWLSPTEFCYQYTTIHRAPTRRFGLNLTLLPERWTG